MKCNLYDWFWNFLKFKDKIGILSLILSLFLGFCLCIFNFIHISLLFALCFPSFSYAIKWFYYDYLEYSFLKLIGDDVVNEDKFEKKDNFNNF